MNKEFLIKYEELLNKGYCDCNEMNCIDNNSPRRILNIAKQLQQENKQLKENYERIYNENCKLREEHNITDISLLDENYKIKDNWNKLKEYLINDINYWKEQEKEWIKLGFIKFGGEANNRIIFEKILNKMQEIEQGSDSNE